MKRNPRNIGFYCSEDAPARALAILDRQALRLVRDFEHGALTKSRVMRFALDRGLSAIESELARAEGAPDAA